VTNERTLGEFEIIERFFAPLAAGAPGAYGLKNDAATLALAPGQELVVTTDLMVEGIDYLTGEQPALIARRLLRINLSDLAAMGARPLGYLVGLALPRGVGAEWFESFAGGLACDQATFSLDLLGGDISATDGPTVLSLTALGTVRMGTALTRGGAKVGDAVYVSGSIGDAALGLAALKGGLEVLSEEGRAALIARYRLPEPRAALGQALVGLVHAALDVSDGLVADLGHIGEVSGVGARIEAARVPLSAPARSALYVGAASFETVLTGGDDYELLFTAPAEADGKIGDAARALGVAITRIGSVEASPGVVVLDERGQPMEFRTTGYRHF